jgi:hypothetical protein
VLPPVAVGREVKRPPFQFARLPACRHEGTTVRPTRGRESASTLSQLCPWPRPRAQFAFKDSMIHVILQFTLGIAFRCVLHRCGSQDIRC